MSVFLEGTILGFSLALLFGFGPAFFALIQTGIHRGFWPGMLLATGIFINDVVIVLISLLGATSILHEPTHYQTMGIVGGGLLIVFGILTYKHKTQLKEADDENIEIKSPHPLIYVGKGFLLNAANPFVWIFWISIVMGITSRYGAQKIDLFLFFAGTLAIVYSTDIIKTFAASRFKNFATNKFLILINKLAGIALVGFGIFLIFRSIFQF
ncbi:MAG: LysE family translocator [Bacteroidales bacterium]|jgi:threonine/homoserine/homoserine lactone efflux protein